MSKKIGLINLEPKIQNTALMQISRHHKGLGDTVEWAMPLMYNQYDKLYCSSLFDFTDKSSVPKNAICGGTGFDIKSKLPFDAEYDYSIYPSCDVSYVWFSRGCIRNCEFCLVREKEGVIRAVQPKELNPKGTYIKIQDNNFFANKKWRDSIKWLKDTGQKVDFAGGIDARLLDTEQCEALNSLKHEKQIKIAWDSPKDDLEPILKNVVSMIKPYKLMCYVLIGYWSSHKEDMYRIETLRKLKIDPFVMPFNKKDYRQRRLARWCNNKAIFRTVKWEDYK